MLELLIISNEIKAAVVPFAVFHGEIGLQKFFLGKKLQGFLCFQICFDGYTGGYRFC
jgi:hypothetical protein